MQKVARPQQLAAGRSHAQVGSTTSTQSALGPKALKLTLRQTVVHVCTLPVRLLIKRVGRWTQS